MIRGIQYSYPELPSSQYPPCAGYTGSACSSASQDCLRPRTVTPVDSVSNSSQTTFLFSLLSQLLLKLLSAWAGQLFFQGLLFSPIAQPYICLYRSKSNCIQWSLLSGTNVQNVSILALPPSKISSSAVLLSSRLLPYCVLQLASQFPFCLWRAHTQPFCPDSNLAPLPLQLFATAGTASQCSQAPQNKDKLVWSMVPPHKTLVQLIQHNWALVKTVPLLKGLKLVTIYLSPLISIIFYQDSHSLDATNRHRMHFKCRTAARDRQLNTNAL